MLSPGLSLILLNCLEGIIVILRISGKSRNSYLPDAVQGYRQSLGLTFGKYCVLLMDRFDLASVLVIL